MVWTPKLKYQLFRPLVVRMFLILVTLNLSQLVLGRSSDKTVMYITNQQFPLSRSYKGRLEVKQKCKSPDSTCFNYTWLGGLSETFSDLFHVCPLFLVMQPHFHEHSNKKNKMWPVEVLYHENKGLLCQMNLYYCDMFYLG